MATLFDQYEQAAARSAAAAVASNQQADSNPFHTGPSGIISAQLEDDTPIFNRKRIDYRFPTKITHLVVCNNLVAVAMANNVVLRIDLAHPDKPDEVDLGRPADERIHKMFLDPTGKHLLLSMAHSEVLYLSRNGKKPRLATKIRGHVVESVGWNNQNMQENLSGHILIGTTKGLIFETELATGDDRHLFQSSVEQYFKQLFNLGKEKEVPITGLEFEKISSKSLTEHRYFIMATTPGRLYQFIGNIPSSTEPPILQQIFNQYENQPERFLELPGNFAFSELKFYYQQAKSLPTSFAWMTGPGVYYGRIDCSGAAGEDSVTTDTHLLPYPPENAEHPGLPAGVAITEFHVLLLFADCVKAICVLNEQLVFEDPFTERFGRLLGFTKDPAKGTIWLYSERAVFRYKLVRESRDVWQIYLNTGEYDLAKEYCKDNPVNRDKVLTKQAESIFKQGDYLKAAECYAMTENSFEEVALKFIQVGEKEALKTFLLKKLATLKMQEKSQMTMLVIWIVELFLTQLGQLREKGDTDSSEYQTLQQGLYSFFEQQRVLDCASDNRRVLYDLMASHGGLDDLVHFAAIMSDFDRVIAYYIQHDQYDKALGQLSRQSDTSLFYKFSPQLMQAIPRQLVDAWLSAGRKLDPKRLIPALVNYDQEMHTAQNNEAIRYLEFVVETLSNKDQAIHNYLLSLYVKLQPEKLLDYLKFQGQDAECVSYDLKYALRLCAEKDLYQACIHIYTTLGLYEEAVDLALKVDLDLAKENANMPEDNEELKKKLWLRIARHVVEEEKDIKKAMEFLHECELIKIEDILPFFPDFVTIDHFKDAICTSLQEYNKHIEDLQEDMNEATESAQEIRDEIHAFRNRYSVVKSQDKCSSCGFPILTRTFYLFPCQHVFHADCMLSLVQEYLNSSKRQKVDQLKSELAAGRQQEDVVSLNSMSSGPASVAVSKHQQLKAELDDLIASECVFCGDLMVRSIDKPFIDPSEMDDVMQQWL